MKPFRDNILALCVGLATVGVALGCGEAGHAGASSGAADGGYVLGGGCLWGGGNGGGLSFPVCTKEMTSEFMGTIDGKPYDLRDSGHFTALSPIQHPPYQLSLALTGAGSLDLDWGDPYVHGRWTALGGGVFVVPGDGKPRAVFSDSQLLASCDDYAFLYILHVTGGDLTGCSR
jgi:hypothetical protein